MDFVLRKDCTSTLVIQTTYTTIFGVGILDCFGGSNEVIRHAMAEKEEMTSPPMVMDLRATNSIRFRPIIGPRNHSLSLFIPMVLQVLDFLRLPFPATIQNGKYYNNEFSKIDFRGEGFRNGTKYNISTITKDINEATGKDENVSSGGSRNQIVRDGTLKVRIGKLRKFTTIKFTKAR